MRYLVKAKVKEGREMPLQQAIDDGTLGQGSIAGDEYGHDMQHARQLDSGTVCWVETCFCSTPLQEEQPYWEEYFELLKIKNAHDPRRCKDLNGTEPWACCDCDCTERLEARMQQWGEPFLPNLRKKLETSGGRAASHASQEKMELRLPQKDTLLLLRRNL